MLAQFSWISLLKMYNPHFCEKKSLIRKGGHICSTCEVLFTKSDAFNKHSSWCTGESSKKKAKALTPKSASYWAKSSNDGYASDFRFIISGSTTVEHILLAYQQEEEELVAMEDIRKAQSSLSRRLWDPKYHQSKRKLQRYVVWPWEN